MTEYKLIIWDWNGTLLDDLDICVEVMNEVLKARKLLPISKDRYKTIFGFPVRDYYEKLGFDFTREPFEKISTEYINNYQKRSLHAALSKNCTTILDYFKEQGKQQVILSASQLDNLIEQVKHFGIFDYFEKLIGLDHCHATSKAEIGKCWLYNSGYNSKEALLIGDTIHDYETARELGCDCILLANGHQSTERVSCLGVPVIGSLEDLISIL